MKRSKILALGLALALTAGLLAGCTGGSGSQSPSPTPSQTVTPPDRLVTRWNRVSAAPVLLRGYAARSRSGDRQQKPAASAS